MDEEQRARFEQALARKHDEAELKAAAGQPHAAAAEDKVHGPIEGSLIHPGAPQDVFDPRDKNQGKGKKTADKWNQ